MGLTSSGDEFCARTDKALAGIPGVFKLVDDILMLGDSMEQLLDHTANDYISATTFQLYSSCTSSLITSRSSL